MFSWGHLIRLFVKNVQPILRSPDSEFALRAPWAALGFGLIRPANTANSGQSPSRRVHHPHSEAEEAEETSAAERDGVRRRARTLNQQAAIRSHFHHQQCSLERGFVARLAQIQPMAGDAGDRTTAPALALSQFQWNSPFLLSGRSSRNRDLADRGRSLIQEW